MIPCYVEAWWELIRFEFVLLTRNFDRLHRLVRAYPVRQTASSGASTERIISDFEVACTWYPKHVRCLQRSAALTCLCRRHGIPAQMVIGTQKLPFKAHAWVELKGLVLNDKQYTPNMYAVLDRW
jgi:prolyl oligopeptidase